MRTYGILLIGCGHIGMQHLEDIYYRPNVRIEGVVDQDPARAQEAARRLEHRLSSVPEKQSGGCGYRYHRHLYGLTFTDFVGLSGASQTCAL